MGYTCICIDKLVIPVFFFSSIDCEFQIRLIWVFTVLMLRKDSSHVSAHFFFQQIVKSRSDCANAQAHRGIRCYHVTKVDLQCFGARFFQQTANSGSGSADVQAHMTIH